MPLGIALVEFDRIAGGMVSLCVPDQMEIPVNTVQQIQISHNFTTSYIITEEQNWNSISFYNEDTEIIIPESEQAELPATVEMVIESDIPEPESTADKDKTSTIPTDLIPTDPDAPAPIADESKVEESVATVETKPKTDEPIWSPKSGGSE